MFTLYSKPNCQYCDLAKNLLTLKNQPFSVVHLDVGQEKISSNQYITREQLLVLIPGAKTMPQITNNQSVVGGYTDLQQLIGKL